MQPIFIGNTRIVVDFNSRDKRSITWHIHQTPSRRFVPARTLVMRAVMLIQEYVGVLDLTT